MDPFKWCSRSTAARGDRLGAENAENVLLLHDQVLFAVQRDLASRVLAEQHAIACLDIQGSLLAVLVDRPFADGEDLALLGLLLGAVRDDEAAAANLRFLDPLDQDAVVERVQGGLQWLSHGADASLCQGCMTVTLGGVSGPNASLRLTSSIFLPSSIYIII